MQDHVSRLVGLDGFRVKCVIENGDQDRGEGVAQLVAGEPARERHQAAALQQLVGAPQDGGEDAPAQVVWVATRAVEGREDEVVGIAAVGGRLVGREDVAQDRQHPDLPQPGRRLRAADEQTPVREVDIAPEQVAELVRARVGEEERREDRLAFGQFVVRIAVEVRRRLQ